ncbi:MAG: hypothetical protein J3Q66DRAFT_150743 [Benniella sp.]|nr:MAG: hypothetical protein J3Q66DRAFT_150743 [Benniella sp.]
MGSSFTCSLCGIESDLSCDLFKEEINADETRDHSRVEQHPGMVDAAGNPLGQINGILPRGKNEIFSQEFMAALRAPLITTTPPQLESSKGRNLLEGLHVVPPVANVSLSEEEIRNIVRNSQQQKQQQQQQQQERLQEIANDAKKEKSPEEKARDKEIYQAARKSFLDSLKMADPIKTPHKFAPLPLPIMWNDPKIRSRALPSFELSDYREKPKPLSIPIKLIPKNVDTSNNNGALPPQPPQPPSASVLSSSPSQTLYSTSPTPTLPQSMATTTTTTITTTITTTTMPSAMPAEAAGVNSSKHDSISSSPTKMHSILNSMHSSLSSFATSPPTTTAMDAMSRMVMSPQTPTAAGFANGPDTPQPAQQLQQQQQQLQLQQQLFKEQQEQQQQQQQEKKQELSPPPADRPRRHSSIQNPHLAFDPTITPEEREAKSAKNTLERRSTLQQAVRAKFQVDSDQETTNGDDQGGSMRRSLRSTSARKRRSLHQDLFVQEQPPSESRDASVDNGQDAGVANDEAKLQPPHPQGEGMRSRRGSRPLSANILPESLTSYNNHPSYQDKEKKKSDEDEEGSPTTATASASATTTTLAATSPTALRPPGTLSLGRATGPRYTRSGSNSSATSSGTQQQQISPTTPTTVHPYATLSGRTPRPQQPGSARSSLSGISGGMQNPGIRTSQQFHQQPLDDDAGAGADEHEVPPTLSRLTAPQSAASTLSRSDSKILSPGQRRSGLYAPAPPAAAAQDREIDTSRSHQQNPRLSFSSSPPTERYEDHYRPESREDHHQVPSRRNSYLRQRATSGDRDRETPDWQGDDDEDQLPRRYSLQRPSLRDAAMTLRRASTEFQKESLEGRGHVRSRTQDLYSRSSGYGDFDTEFDEEYPRGLTRRTSSSSNASALTARYSPQSPMKDMKDYFSSTGRSGAGAGGLTSPPVPVPSSAGSRFSDHHRRLSRDGLLPTQRVSPPPSASATTAHHRLSSSSLSGLSGLSGPNGSSGVPPRRSASNVTGSSIIPPATVTNTRRLSISGGSGSGYGHGRSASSSSLTGLGVTTTGAGAYGAGPKAGMYSAGGALDRYSMSDRRGLSISESSGGHHSSHFTPPPRVVPHRGSNSSTGSGSGSRANSMSMGMGSSEYTRGVAPPSRASTGGLGYGGHSASSRSQQYADDYDPYDFRPDVPTRHSSLGGTAIGRGGTSSLRSSVQSMSSGPLPSSSQLRRATSTTLNKGGPGGGMGGGAYGGASGYGGNGTASLGRNSGGNMMGGRQYQQPPPSYQRGGYI